MCVLGGGGGGGGGGGAKKKGGGVKSCHLHVKLSKQSLVAHKSIFFFFLIKETKDIKECNDNRINPHHLL